MVNTIAVLLFALGFVTFLDLLARYPDGSYMHPVLGQAVTALATVAMVLVGLAVFGSELLPSVLGEEGAANPAHVEALGFAAELAPAVTLHP